MHLYHPGVPFATVVIIIQFYFFDNFIDEEAE